MSSTAARKPNILFLMSDEHAPMFSGPYGHPMVLTPNLDRLASEGVTFENAYCNSPLCVPSRMSLMTGRFVRNIGTWDNTSPLASDEVTWAHLLRAAGYDVVLAGKQHFIGPDQLHGFRAQLARDLHAELDHPIFPWGDGARPRGTPWPDPLAAGPGTGEHIAVDDQVEDAAVKYLRDPARQDQPWALCASFIAPHFPFVVPEKYWNMYPPDEIELPTIPPGHLESQHPAIKGMRAAFGLSGYANDVVRRARAGYFGLITYLDDKIGHLLNVLDEIGQAENTLVIYTSDHGEMAGEHGMWRKSNFYEQSARVPLQLRWPGSLPAGARVPEVVSLVDLVASIRRAADVPDVGGCDGTDLLPLACGEQLDWKDEAFSEYLAHGVSGPMAMLRRGRYKLNYYLDDAPELFDLEADPGEYTNLAKEPDMQSVLDHLRERLLSQWDPIALQAAVRTSQEQRMLIGQAGGWRRASEGPTARRPV